MRARWLGCSGNHGAGTGAGADADEMVVVIAEMPEIVPIAGIAPSASNYRR
ncbi:MAG: hypothetical protein KBD96_02485 [Brachymonas sp.]|nr:hypothetical protein [Brachymonas sp.]MBP6139055.1 hypothetical protein [Brachymonas sp.]MBP7247363.1 hypothetical protein [Brachymonas sp.]MBP8746927.1 hypothetical protein [Brachymonas sp.]MBP9589876.1 hypothetical protein [Brachymonas sp.]